MSYLTDLVRERYKSDLTMFFREAWGVIEPDTKLVENWHIPYLCSELTKILTRVVNREAREYDLLVNIPPSTTKSTLITIIFPVWCWIHAPWLKIITISYAESLALLHATKSRDIIISDWFQSLFGTLFSLKYDVNKKSEYANDASGVRIALGMRGGIMGKHGDLLIFDDPNNPNVLVSLAEIEEVNRRYDQTMSTRLTDLKVSTKIHVMQRLSRKDLSGHILNKKGVNIKHVCLPAELTKDVSPKEIAERYIDGLLDPVRLDRSILSTMKANLGTHGYTGQYLQSPLSEEGNLVKPEWFGTFRIKTLEDRAYDDHSAIVWNYFIDGAYTDKEINAPTACVAAARYKADLFIRDVTRVWMELPELIKFLPDWVKRNGYSDGSRIYIEPKASGMSAAQMLKRYTPFNVILDKAPTTDKISRLKSCLPYLEAGRVNLLQGSSWEKMFIDELRLFPHSEYKDITDATVMAIKRSENLTEAGSVLSIRAI